jgi:hypothetical protein
MRGWTTEESWFDSCSTKRYFSSSKRPDWLWGPPRLLHRRIFPGLGRLGLEFDHLPTCSSVVKNEWSYASILYVASEHLLRIFDSLAFILRLLKSLWRRKEKVYCWNHRSSWVGCLKRLFICRKLGEIINHNWVQTLIWQRFGLLRISTWQHRETKTVQLFPLISCCSWGSEFRNIDLISYNDYVLLFS